MELSEYAGMIASYGALGICTLYFMWKDCTLNKELTEALKEFTVAVNVLTNRGND